MPYAYECQKCGKIYQELANPKDKDSTRYCPTCYEAIQKSKEEEKAELNARPTLQIKKHGAFADPDTKVISFRCETCCCEWDIEKTDCDLSRGRDGKLVVSCKCPECLSTKTVITKVITVRNATKEPDTSDKEPPMEVTPEETKTTK